MSLSGPNLATSSLVNILDNFQQYNLGGYNLAALEIQLRKAQVEPKVSGSRTMQKHNSLFQLPLACNKFNIYDNFPKW